MNIEQAIRDRLNPADFSDLLIFVSYSRPEVKVECVRSGWQYTLTHSLQTTDIRGAFFMIVRQVVEALHQSNRTRQIEATRINQ
jgi:hypothetical protein